MTELPPHDIRHDPAATGWDRWSCYARRPGCDGKAIIRWRYIDAGQWDAMLEDFKREHSNPGEVLAKPVACLVCMDGTLCNCAVNANQGRVSTVACACIGFLSCSTCGRQSSPWHVIT